MKKVILTATLFTVLSALLPVLAALCLSACNQKIELTRTEVESIKILENFSNNLPQRNTVKLSYTISPEDADPGTITWTSSDEAIATVDSDGNVTGFRVGEATITVTTTNGKSDSVTIRVCRLVAGTGF